VYILYCNALQKGVGSFHPQRRPSAPNFISSETRQTLTFEQMITTNSSIISRRPTGML